LAGIKEGQQTCLIAHHVLVGSVYGIRVASFELGIGLGRGVMEKALA